MFEEEEKCWAGCGVEVLCGRGTDGGFGKGGQVN